jgi:hypothetical protein
MDEADAGMNRRNLFILLAVFVGLTVLAAFQAQQRNTFNPAAETAAGSFLGRDLNLTVLDIQAIRLRDPNSEVSFVVSRDTAGNWTAPLNEGSLDQDAASSIARTVVLAGYQQTLPITDTTDLSQYGFQPNGIFSVDVLRTDTEGHVIAFGNMVPSGTAYYAIIDDKSDIFFIERGAVEYLMAYMVQPPLT